MTETSSMPTVFAPSDFRIRGILNRISSLLSRHFLVFIVVTIIANLPLLLALQGAAKLGSAAARGDALGPAIIMVAVGFVPFVVLSILSQTVIVHATFKAMRARPINLGESFSVGLARFIPVFLLGLIMGTLVALASLFLLIPGLVLIVMWFVGIPACVVERLGPWMSLKRSAELTKGHRWEIFGLLALLFVIGTVASTVIEWVLAPIGIGLLTMLGTLISNALWSAYYSIAVVVVYHDLRVAKEGLDIEQIAAVFD